ncbi:MAG: hypothetical protein EOP48_16785 [Sphingobacteriales bacterium]|nr:MAG: hypothetical protein EOP48_16785 [Sphingobacteriales bacterium]
MGDDARDILLLDTAFTELKRIRIFDGKDERLSKKIKADIESAEFLDNRRSQLLLLGSGSVSPTRDSLFILDLKRNRVDKFGGKEWLGSLLTGKTADLNIEGATLIDTFLVLANRSNLKSKQNYLIVNGLGAVSYKFSENVTLKQSVSSNDNGLKRRGSASEAKSHNRAIPLNIEEPSYGISGLDYSKKKDLLVLTCSSEATSSAFADGEIGNSAIGLIQGISRKLKADSLKVDAWIPLSNIDKRFDKMKMESVAIGGEEKNGVVLYLVSDNDDGKSTLFKVRLLLR